LKQSSNPESGPINYSYYASGELSSKTDNRGVVTDYYYDPLHRLTKKRYSDANGTTDNDYTYYKTSDGSPNKVGLLKQSSSPDATNANDTFDNLGRVLTSHHTITGHPATFNFSYSYFLTGAVQSLTNQSTGRVVTYAADAAGRTASVSSAGVTYADLSASGSYAPDGRIAKLALGNGLYESRTYEKLLSSPSRLVTTFNVGTTSTGSEKLKLEYDFSPTANNGNVTKQTITGVQSFTQEYGYDALNRLTYANEGTAWTQCYGYDRYGNQWIDHTGSQNQTSNCSNVPTSIDIHEIDSQDKINANNNRLNVYGVDFDGGGNQTKFSPFDLSYDAENRMTKARESDTHMSTYAYDADGRRVKRVVISNSTTSSTTYYVHNALGQLAAEYSTQAPTSGRTYIHTDMLGSTRLVTDQNKNIVECYDYLPFGRMLTTHDQGRTATCYPGDLDLPATQTEQMNSKSPDKFTGKERDPETRLDFFGARYYSSAQGRWTTPDWSATPAAVPYANLGNPQTLNLYQYVGNNPASVRDADGHCWPAYVCAHAIMDGITHLRETVERKATGTGNVGLAFAATLPMNVAEEMVHTFVNPFTVGEASGKVWDSGNTGDRILAGIEDTGKAAQVGLTMLGAAGAAGRISGKLSGNGQLLREAEIARDALANEVGPSKATVSAGYNSKTGKVVAAACEGGKCAEDVVHGKLEGGADGFTKAVRPRTGKEVPICARCEATYGRDKFPAGTKFETDGK
jgi:RHS repeat-associated protein